MGIKLMNSVVPLGYEKMVIKTSDSSGGHLRLFPGTNKIVLTSMTSGVGGDSLTFRSTNSGNSYSEVSDFPMLIQSFGENISVSFNNKYYYVGDPSLIDGSAYIAVSNNGGQSFEYKAPSAKASSRYITVASSRDGKYTIASNGQYDTYGDAILSQDFGETWTNPVGIGYYVQNFVSPTGKNMIIGSFSNNETKYSDNYGNTWSTFPETLSSFGGAMISGDGNYKVVYEQYEKPQGSRSRCYISTDWINWTQHNLTTRLIGGSISNDGKYMLIAASDGVNSPEYKLNLSIDYGVSFSEIIFSDTNYWAGTAMSSDGKYMIAIPGFNFSRTVYKSIDHGSTWVPVTEITHGRFNNVQMSKNGRYTYLSGRSGGGLWYSNDYMATWTQQFDGSTGSGVFINF